MDENRINGFALKGCHVQKDGNFGAAYAFYYVEYPTVYFTDSDASPGQKTIIDNVKYGVIQQYDSDYADIEQTGSIWTFNYLDINIDSTSLEREFIDEHGPVTDSPEQADASVSWSTSNLVETSTGKSFLFSDDDLAPIDN